jgi:uncharacterized integral membrane protein
MKNRSTYFRNMSRILLLFVFLGFAPSFYLKFLLDEHSFYPDGLPLPHVIHGIILTVWYVFLVVQTGLIESNRFNLHQRLGWFGAVWAVLVLVSTVWVISVFPNRMQSLAHQLQSTVDEVEPGLTFILWLDVFMCLLFIGFLTTAIVKRNEAAIHKRLMLYTGLVFIFAATNRMAGSIAYITGLDISMPLGLLLLVSLTGSLLLHDRKAYGRILGVSWWCFGLYWAGVILSLVISSSD